MYDIFLSHSSEQKLWVREVAKFIDEQSYLGRPLRSWFDEQELSVGDKLRPELEAALESSRYLGIVLSESALDSEWVRFEWDHWMSKDPDLKRVIPLYVETCNIPIKYSDLIQIDFRDRSQNERGLQKLLNKLRKIKGQSTNDVRNEAQRLLRNAEANNNGDLLFAYLKQFAIDDLDSEGLIISAFDGMLDELQESNNPYILALIVAECLATLQLESPQYAQLPQKWEERDHWAVLLVEIRANSKIAEISHASVDVGLIYHLAAKLDEKMTLSKDDRTLIGHIARTVGKIQDTRTGSDLIEALSQGGVASRTAAAGALSIDPSEPGGWYFLSKLKSAEKRKVQWAAPSPRLLLVLLKLSKESVPSVKESAESTINWLTHKGLTISEHMTEPVADDISELQTSSGKLLPFAGRICKATTSNMEEIGQGLTPGTVVCLTHREVLEFYFRGAAGLIIPEQGSLTHQCVRLMNTGIPFAMLKTSQMKQIPDGAWVTVDRNGVCRIKG